MLPTQPLGPGQVPVSRIALGCMGLAGTWNPVEVGPEHRGRAIAAFEAALDAGITFFDHADIYGGTACESIFRDCLAAVPGSRERIIIATKFAIRDGYYDHSPKHIAESIRASLQRMGIDYVDLYQVHRPDPLSHPAETAEVLDRLVEQRVARMIGVSNYYPQQTLALQRYLHTPLVSNQVSTSLLRLDPIYEGSPGPTIGHPGDGVLDQCLELGMTPLAYSPLGAGWLTGRQPPPDHPQRDAIERILLTMREMSRSYDDATPAQLAIAWLLRHPARIIPIVGSTNPAHIHKAAAAAKIELTREDWYKLWVAARGEEVP